MIDGIRAYIYQERDSGIMLIGSRSALQGLIAELTTSLQNAPEKEEADWPRELCSFSVPDPNGSDWPYAVSIHLATVTGTKPSLPEFSRSPGKFQILLWLLAGVGIISIVRWLLSLI